jgi:hypothetical protein
VLPDALVEPVGHEVHEEDPAVDHVLTGHVVMVPPEHLEPAGHVAQVPPFMYVVPEQTHADCDVLPAALVEPAGHDVHDVVPPVEYVLVGHCVGVPLGHM